MKIKTIHTQSRRDFTATLECEHCEHEQRLSHGYDDDNFHRNVIPKIPCGKCGQCSPTDYRPLTTKYAAHEVV
jgi:transcription elongation factor Elf1